MRHCDFSLRKTQFHWWPLVYKRFCIFFDSPFRYIVFFPPRPLEGFKFISEKQWKPSYFLSIAQAEKGGYFHSFVYIPFMHLYVRLIKQIFHYNLNIFFSPDLYSILGRFSDPLWNKRWWNLAYELSLRNSVYNIWIWKILISEAYVKFVCVRILHNENPRSNTFIGTWRG